ncbi:MAG: CarD family transcriptional regulator [Bryobacteraceae bacterium]|jgi:CarD family transcriptional regulator
MTFQIGEKVVYPSYGVGTVEGISARSFGSVFENFYLLRFGSGGTTVVAPFSHAASIGLRRVTKGRAISRILAFLSSGACAVNPDWKARFKENSEKMRSGDLPRTAEVLKSLLRLQRERQLSFREKKMLEGARRMLVSEISIARQMPETFASAVLQRALAKAGLTLPAAR